MLNETRKDFNAVLNARKDMPKIQIITDPKAIAAYGGDRMYFAPPIDYDRAMRRVPFGKLLTVGDIRSYLARRSGADFTEPLTAGLFVSIAAWASHQRAEDKIPYWRTLKTGGELNEKYPGGAEAQKALLEAEGHTVLSRGRKHLRYYVQDYEKALFSLEECDSHLTSGPQYGTMSFASKLDSRADGAKGLSVRKVRAPQGKDNG